MIVLFRSLLLTLLVSLTVIQVSQAQQTDDEAIRQSMATYLDHARNQRIDGLLDELYPGICTILPRDQMQAYFQRFFTDEEVRFRFESMDVSSISPVFRTNGRAFARINYHLVMSMEYRGAQQDDSVLEMLRHNVVSEYGADHVRFDESTSTFQIDADKIMLAIRDKQASSWKVMDYDKTLTPFLEQMDIPAEVITHFELN